VLRQRPPYRTEHHFWIKHDTLRELILMFVSEISCPTYLSVAIVACWSVQLFLKEKQLNRSTCHLECGFILFFSHPESEGWPHHGHTFAIYLCPLSLWLTLSPQVLSTSWCPSRLCMVFLSCVHLALFLALSLSSGNSLVASCFEGV